MPFCNASPRSKALVASTGGTRADRRSRALTTRASRGSRRQQAAEAVEPFVFVVRARAGAEAQREPLARLQRRGQFRREQRAQGAGLFGLHQRSAADEQVSGPIGDSYHLHLGIYTSKSWAKRASSNS